MNVTLTVDVGDEERVLLVPKHDGEYAKVGTVAEVTDRIRLARRGRAVALSGLHRGVAGAASTDSQGRLFVDVEERPDDESRRRQDPRARARVPRVVETILELRGDDGRIAAFVRSISRPGALATRPATRPTDLRAEGAAPGALDVRERLELALELQRERLALMQVRQRIQDVESGVEKQQREYILRRQLDSIRKELGEDEASVVEEYRAKIAEAEMPENVLEQAERELSRLERMGDQTPEATVIRNYLDWLLAVPWNARSEERLDPNHARGARHRPPGLEDVKDRIVEYIAVAKLRKERGVEEDRRSGAILTLIGPARPAPARRRSASRSPARPGASSSACRSAASATRPRSAATAGRTSARFRARLVRALRDAGTMNPVIMLDEGRQGRRRLARRSPPSALLEVLDPPRTIRSATTTSTWSSTSPRSSSSRRGTWPRRSPARSSTAWRSSASTATRPTRRSRSRAATCGRGSASGTACARTRSRSRTTRSSSSPSTRARRACASSSASSAPCCVRPTKIASEEVEPPVEIDPEAVREALGRQKFYREVAERTAVPGVATGLAATATGGDVLFIEATAHKDGDKLVLTGQLGDVMKESAQIALSAVRARRRARDRRGRLRRSRVPCARSRRSDPEGRAERRHHDGDRPSRRCSRTGP